MPRRPRVRPEHPDVNAAELQRRVEKAEAAKLAEKAERLAAIPVHPHEFPFEHPAPGAGWD